MTFAPPPSSTSELYKQLKIHLNWGYVIYRTTYSPQSDTHFSTAVKFVEASIKKSFFRECESRNESSPGVDLAIYEEVWAKHSSTVMEDAALFDGASMDSIRAHFEDWIDAQGQRDSYNKYRMCMVIDQESLQTLLGTSAEALDQDQETKCESDKTMRYVKVLEAWHYIDQYDTFPGWMKCWTRALWDLWTMMCGFDEMRMSWEKIDEFCQELYCG